MMNKEEVLAMLGKWLEELPKDTQFMAGRKQDGFEISHFPIKNKD